MAMNGLMSNARSFEVMGDRSPSDAAAVVITAIASVEIDAGILWGPLGGYYAQTAKVPLALVPLVKEKAGPATIYGITMGVRPNEPEWKHKLNKLIAANQADINAMLSEYNVPLLDENGNLIKISTAEREALHLAGALRLVDAERVQFDIGGARGPKTPLRRHGDR